MMNMKETLKLNVSLVSMLSPPLVKPTTLPSLPNPFLSSINTPTTFHSFYSFVKYMLLYSLFWFQNAWLRLFVYIERISADIISLMLGHCG